MSVKAEIEGLLSAVSAKAQQIGLAVHDAQRLEDAIHGVRAVLGSVEESQPVEPVAEAVQEPAPAVTEPTDAPAESESQEPVPAVTPADPAPEPSADPSAPESPAETEQAPASQEPTV